jgi:hypothetical protein
MQYWHTRWSGLLAKGSILYMNLGELVVIEVAICQNCPSGKILESLW